MQNFQTIKIEQRRAVCTITIHRPEVNNSINSVLIEELLYLLRTVENDSEVKVLVLQGNQDNFCTGMDFNTVSEQGSDMPFANDPNAYYDLLKHLSTCSKVVIALVEGKVNAGGVGIVAASDIVIADHQVSFGLSEALFGLLPACVMPFLIKRIGLQKAQWMALMTQGISTQRAYEIGLVDEQSANVQDSLRRCLLRITRLETATIKELKNYMSKLWIINEETQQLAVQKITTLMQSDRVQHNITNFVQNGIFPWSK